MPDDCTEFVLHHPCGLRVARDLVRDDVAAMDGVVARDMGTGYVWYDLPIAEIAGVELAMSVCFFHEKVDGVSLAAVAESFGASWAEWSEAGERARTAATSKWLADIGFPVGDYPWGVVFAETSNRTGDGGGGVRFTRRGAT